jgi:hypothetical protein
MTGVSKGIPSQMTPTPQDVTFAAKEETLVKKWWNDAGMSMKTKDRPSAAQSKAGMLQKTKVVTP